MLPEQDKALAVLKLAIRMENDGQKYYSEQSRLINNEPGRLLFCQLAGEEDNHRQRVEVVYATLSRKQNWPVVPCGPDRADGIKTLFARAVAELGLQPTVIASELDAIQKALDMENACYDFYQGYAEQATGKAEQEFYETLAGEERGHYLMLLDYYEYLKHPAFWFARKEHHSLDGG